jgi:hypothetical protein
MRVARILGVSQLHAAGVCKALIMRVWGQSKNTVGLAGGAGLLPGIFTLTPNIPKYH